ncbi:hypothetical protein VTJ83DRAFT_4551 [Remersonia thermophila]|uniref:HTH CENPB-type domain-containing protein n=1 Tax=Remersonia thermophila TaxID=72144 RepID=A0ABR4DB64_9PEZI
MSTTPDVEPPATTTTTTPPTATTAATTATPTRERNSLTLDQRRALRRWASSQPVRPSHKACIEWFQTQFNQRISQSTVSHSLSPKYARLDNDTQLSGSRLRFGNWPDVERLVLLWHHQMVNQGKQPSNEELAEKAKIIFTQLPRYKDEEPPEFSPGWIHRFKKRYGLLVRRQRQRRPSNANTNTAEDIPYLVDAVNRFMNITPDISPAAIQDVVQRVIGVEPSLHICARVRDEIVRQMDGRQQPGAGAGAGAGQQPVEPATPQQQQQQQHHHHQNGPGSAIPGSADAPPLYADEDPEVVLQNALRALQQEEAAAEAAAAAEREARDRADRGMSGTAAYTQQAAAAVSAARATSTGAAGASSSSSATPCTQARFVPATTPAAQTGPAAPGAEDLTLTPIPSGAPVSATERPVRCPFCLNQRMLRTIKEAVEHMSTHVIV